MAQTVETELMRAIGRYAARNPKSKAQHERAKRHFPGGHTRQTLFHEPFPITIVGAVGPVLTDLDGHEYLDLQGDYTAGLYGHTPKQIQAAINDTAAKGVSIGGVCQQELELAALISSRIPSIEQMRFCHSGSEACMFSVLLSRHATGRGKILVFTGGYHGGFLMFSPPRSALNAPFETIECTYNDIVGTQRALNQSAKDLAAILLEPMMGSSGCIPASQSFLDMLRSESARLGILLIFDEVMTSRLSPGGAQAIYGINPDLTTLGKYWGGGFGFGAFGGRRDLMAHLDTAGGGALSQAGTYNNNAIAMAAGYAGVTSLFPPEACVGLNARGDELRTRINVLGREGGVALQATGLGSVMTLHWQGGRITSAADVEAPSSAHKRLFHLEMLNRGILVASRGMISLSLALSAADLARFLDTLQAYVEDYRSILPGRAD